MGEQHSETLGEVRFGLPAAGDRINGVGLGAVTAQQLSGEMTVNGKSRAKPRHASQRTIVKRFVPEGQALHHAPYGFGIRRQVMAKGGNGGVLVMRIASHNTVQMQPGHFRQGLQQSQGQAHQVDHPGAHPQTHIRDDLVVATAGGMHRQASLDAKVVGQKFFDIGMHILERWTHDKLPSTIALLQLVETAQNRLALCGGENSLSHKHACMGPVDPQVKGH